ncbi:MAG TPA: 30S ribosome-binding factor RbfA [Nitrospinota bacterium]|nr:30S ribosome-binding factor RbfA [Nitrospinota bacterium]
MPYSKRTERVSGLLLKEISQLLLRDIKDPRIGFSTLTKIEVTKDLRYAKVFVSILGRETDKIQTLRGLVSASGFIRGELGRRLRLKHIPELIFKIDDSIEHAANISKKLEEIKSKDK